MTICRDDLTKAETVSIAAIEAGVPALVEARELIADFHAMIKTKQVASLLLWLDEATQSVVAFGNVVRKDEVAVAPQSSRLGRTARPKAR